LFYFILIFLGLTDAGCELPSRLGPKRATRILKQFGLVSLYKKKSRDLEERIKLKISYY
jgi:hypothetical protein